jgi:hypothetical protein
MKSTRREKMTMNHVRKVVLIAGMLGFTESQAAQGPDFPAADYDAGGHTLSFDGKENFRLTGGKDNTVLVEGVYSVSSDNISLTDQRGPYACTGEQAKGNYRWAVSKGSLKLSKLQDACDARSSDLTAQPWLKK